LILIFAKSQISLAKGIKNDTNTLNRGKNKTKRYCRQGGQP
jgi:hypothetical protein